MTLQYDAAVLHRPGAALAIERISAAPLGRSDVLVRVRAAGLCHTDLEVIEGSLRYPMPILLGHEAAGVVEEVGSAVTKVRRGDHVILSWNPHCGHCFYCDRALADPVRGLPCAGAARGCVRRGKQGQARRWARAQASDVPRRLRRILHRAGAAGDPGRKRDPVRPRLPDRMRSDDRRRCSLERGAHWPRRLRDGHRLRRRGAFRGTGRASGRGSRHHRLRHR